MSPYFRSTNRDNLTNFPDYRSAVESAIEGSRQQWEIEKNENPFTLPTRLLYLNSAALLRYPDDSLPILEDGSIDPSYICLSGIPAEEL